MISEEKGYPQHKVYSRSRQEIFNFLTFLQKRYENEEFRRQGEFEWVWREPTDKYIVKEENVKLRILTPYTQTNETIVLPVADKFQLEVHEDCFNYIETLHRNGVDHLKRGSLYRLANYFNRHIATYVYVPEDIMQGIMNLDLSKYPIEKTIEELDYDQKLTLAAILHKGEEN